MFDNGKISGYFHLLAKKLFVGSVFLCQTANVLRKALLPVFLKRLAQGTNPCTILPLDSNDNARDGFRDSRFDVREGSSRFGFSLLLFFVLIMAGVSTAKAGLFCSDAPFGGPDNDGDGKADYGIVDGSVDYAAIIPGFVFPTQITIDTECTFQNFPASNPLTATLNFQTNDPSVYLITFNNVIFTGNMACANIEHRIWFVNGSDYGSNNNCQDLFIPVEAIDKQNPAGQTTVGIGDPYTYTLTIPVLFDPVTQTYINNAGSVNDLHSITVIDDLDATGADLSLVGTPTIVRDNGSPLVEGPDYTFSQSTPKGGVLTFVIDPSVIVQAGDQILIDITVVADNTNAVGTQIVNTATWTFGRLIEIDGVPTPFDPLPGENGVTEPLIISAPDLIVTKTGSTTAINSATTANFTIDVQNAGGSDAWGATILDLLPDVGAPDADIGMCDFDPTSTVTAQVFAADGVTPVSVVLAPGGVDYSVTYNDANHATDPCQISFAMLSAATVIGSGERLIINYDSRLDTNGTDVGDSGTVLTNIAGATEYFSADPDSGNPGATFTNIIDILDSGTPGITDFQDSFDITATLSGYVFLKTVINVNTGEDPATTAAPGDTLRYRLHLFNFTETINGLIVTDTLDGAVFDLNSFNMLTPLPDGVAEFSYNSGSGKLTIDGIGNADLNLDPDPLSPTYNPELFVEFEITLDTGLANAIPVSNQALAETTIISTNSDDPFINGVFDPDNPVPAGPDSTDVIIQAPGALSKLNPVLTTEYTIGERFTYTIRVPANTVNTPLYDVRILDDLATSGADLAFVSAVDPGGTWILSNTGSATSPVIEGTGAGIDIPADGQAVIEVTVEMLNTVTNQGGTSFDNVASYTYNRTNGDSGSVTNGGADNSGSMTVVEPNITNVTKVASNFTPTAGEIVTYTIELEASSGATFSDVFDVTLIDNLDPGLEFVVGSSAVSVGPGVGGDNSIGEPDITVDAVTAAQTLVWGVGSTDASDIDIEVGGTITITYQVRVIDSVLAGQVLNNTVVAQWHSLDGAPNFERTGVDGIGGLNDYTTAPVIETLTVPNIDAPIFKVRTTDTYGVADADVRIGDTVEYTLTIPMPEGTLVNMQIVDTLPRGLDFDSIISINGDTTDTDQYSSANSFTYAGIVTADIVEAGDPATGPSTVTWNLGNVTNLPQDNNSNDFVIVYRTRVLNNALDPANTNIPLNNIVDLNYDTAAGPVTNSDNNTINALQPALIVTKTVSTADDTVVVANELITYTVDIANTGTAPAYDVVLRDRIPVGLRNGAATVTIVSSDLVSVAGYAPLPPTSYDNGTGFVTWNFDSGVADAYTIPIGETLRVVYTVLVNPAIGPGLTMINEATATFYYSFDNEAVPANSIVADRQRYGPSNTARTTLTTSPGALQKDNPIDPTVTIGQEFTYTITVPEAAQPTPLYDVRVLDDLSAIGDVTLVSLSNLSGGTWVPSNSGTASNLVILDNTTGGIDIPADQQIEIGITVRLDNTVNNNAGETFSNTASYTYNAVDGIDASQLFGGSDSTLLMTKVEPALTTLKTVSNTTTGKAPADPVTGGDTLTYSLTFTASGGAVGDNFSDVFDLHIDDNLSLGLVYVPGTATVDGAGNIITDPVVSGDGITVAQTLLWRLEDGTADIDIIEGTVVTVTYDVLILDSVLPEQALTNSASSQWTSLDAAIGDPLDPNERNGSATLAENDYFDGPVSTSLTILDNTRLTKTRLSDTFDIVDANVRVGDLVDYELRVFLDEGSHKTLIINDVLPQGLQFERVVSINGDSAAPYNGVAPFTHNNIATPSVAGNAALGQTTVTWTLGDVVNASDNNDTNDEFIIIYRARLLNNDVFDLVNRAGFDLTNAATLNYVTATGAANNSDIEVITLRQPDLTVTKNAAPAGGDPVIDAAESITYTVDVINSGAAPAYDTVVQDILPLGLRQGGISTTNISLVVAGTVLPNLAPVYDPVTGIATWDFDNAGANTYTIPVGETLRIVYTVLADADLGPNQTLINAATAMLYYSFDNEAVPPNGNAAEREEYGPSNTATTTLATPAPAALSKAITQATAAIGEQFSYRITVPEDSQTTALSDVQILDDLNDVLTNYGVDLSFVGVARVSGSQPWTPENISGDSKNLVIADITNGIDIPAGGQVVIDITVVVNDVPANTSGDAFFNEADYTYGATPDPGLPGTSGEMTIVGPDTMELTKTGPPTMRIGLPGNFIISVQNTGTGTAWDMTITDELPNPALGGMCDVAPTNIVAQIYQSDGTTPVDATPLVAGVDYITSFSGLPADPVCTLTLTMRTADAAIGANQWLIVSYDASLDLNNVSDTVLTNVAAATEWFSGDTAGAGATGSIRTYTGVLDGISSADPGTAGITDEQDAWSTTVEVPTLIFEKNVVNVTSGQDPGTDASPGDTLEYTLSLRNIGLVSVPDFSYIDELDALNASPLFVSGSLNITSVLPVGADDSNTDPNGGANGTGLLEIRGLSLDAQGGANDTLEITFEVTLLPVIDSTTVVSNQAALDTYGIIILLSDDINDAAIDDPTETVITSAPLFQLEKVSADITGDPAVLEQADTLQYTLTVKNIGDENAINTLLTDQIPSNTTYVADSTTLNGVTVADPAAGVSALEGGMLINAPENTTAGSMRADTSATADNVATITFEVIVNDSAIDGTVISNQGFVSGDGAGSGVFPQQPSDDPATALVDDATLDVVGSSPVVDVLKTVAIENDVNGNGLVDPGDTLRYTITASNIGTNPATGVVLTDLLPVNTTYEINSTTLNGIALADIGVDSPIFTGVDISSSDLPPPLPASGAGALSAGQSAVVAFDVQVGTLVVPLPVPGTIISNQGFVSSNELPTEPSDADGNDANGDQPTEVVIGNVQFLSITKQVLVVGGGAAEAGGELEYVIRVTNIGGIDASNVVITDTLDPGQMNYITGSGLLNGLPTGVSFTSPTITVAQGGLAIGGVAELRFRVTLNAALIIGDTVTNTADVSWSPTPFTDSATADIDIGGTPGSANLNGQLWHDTDFDTIADAGENSLQGWTVELYRNSVLLASTLSDVNGAYQFSGVLANITPGLPDGNPYEIRFIAPGAVATTATLGHASSAFTDAPQRITVILAASGSSVQGLNQPVQPNGTVYDSVVRTPVAGVQLSMINQTQSNQPVPGNCFVDSTQANQVTTASGFYKFDLIFSQPLCQPGDEYEIQVQPPANGFVGTTSLIIPPVVPVTGAALDVPNCPLDQVPATIQHCENSASASPPDPAIAPRDPGTEYNLHFLFNNALVTNQIFNNHIPVDLEQEAAAAISKVAGMKNVTRSQMVPYTITINNTLPVPLYDLNVIDTFPAGFKYVTGSASVDGAEQEPVVNGFQLTWPNLTVAVNAKREIKLLLIVGAGVGEGEYVNTAQVINSQNNEPFSGIASATVQVIPDPTFDCTDIIGKVFDDKNTNAYQDDGEAGLPGVQVATARGLRVTTDAFGRFHITCAIVANETRGSNFIMKVDDRSLPSGYRITTENPRVQRATRGKMLKFNFGASIHRVVRLDLAAGVFEKGSTELRPQWRSRIDMLIIELQKDASILRLSYLGENETESEVEDRLDAIEELISERWEEIDCCYKLTIEQEVFWRKGKPSDWMEFE